MNIIIFKTEKQAADFAAKKSEIIINKAIKEKGKANIVVATGNSQIFFLKQLTKRKINWKKVEIFPLDEFIGIPYGKKNSFSRFILNNLIQKVYPKTFHLIDGKNNPKSECKRLNHLIKQIDLTFLGIGINGHIAFNDPPADFKTNEPYIIVRLNKENRKQQLKTFKRMSNIPKSAISMSVKQILKSKNIICLAFGKSKAKTVKDCFTKEVSNKRPASVLKKHKSAVICLDKPSASLILQNNKI